MRILNAPFENLLNEEEVESLITDFYMASVIRWKDEPVSFRGGMKSHALLGGREDLTEHPWVLRKVGSLIAKAAFEIAPKGSDPCLIGIPTSGTTLATAASVVSERNLPSYIMRQKLKKHGAHNRWVDGDPCASYHFVTVDNTITDGGSKYDTTHLLRKEGYPVERGMSHLVLVDRGIGGIERMRSHGYRIFSLFDLATLAQAFVEHGSWPQSRLDAILEENDRHRMDP